MGRGCLKGGGLPGWKSAETSGFKEGQFPYDFVGSSLIMGDNQQLSPKLP